jgi:hypothetical protein
VTTILIGPERKPETVTADGYPGRRIEWLGELSPMDDPFIWTGIAAKRFTPEMVTMIRRACLRRNPRTRDTDRALGVNDPGLSREYVWTRRNRWTCILTYADADKVLGCTDGHEFRDLDATEEDEPAILLPPREVQPTATVWLKEIDQFVIKSARDARTG